HGHPRLACRPGRKTWMPATRLRQGFAGPRTHSAGVAIAKTASAGVTSFGMRVGLTSPHFSHHEPVRRWMMVAWRRPSWTVAPEALLRFCFFGLRGFVGDAALSTRRGNACQAGAARAL